ncbi:MAG TPA: hypothetical protein VFR36_03560 [Sphingomicrobium sp.]|nr:hypothetical protein [Sphingomicrobium sp.]
MLAPLLLILASASPAATVPPAIEQGSAYEASSRVTAIATARIRIISGVSFGPDHLEEAAGAVRRKATLSDAAGHVLEAELLEFQ